MAQNVGLEARLGSGYLVELGNAGQSEEML